MTDWLQLGPMLVNLERVEAIQLDLSRASGKPGRCHRVLTMDRAFSFDDDSAEGVALVTWAEGQGFELSSTPAEAGPHLARRLASLPHVPAPEGRPVIGPVCCRMADARPVVAEACTDAPTGGAA
jgi:hypothetical protein